MYKFRDRLSFEIMLDSFLDVTVLKLKQTKKKMQKTTPRTQNSLEQNEEKYFGVMS